MDSIIEARITSIFDRAKAEALTVLREQDALCASPSLQDDEGVTAGEAASLLGVKKWRVYEMVRQGILPAYRPSPKTIRLRRGVINEFLRTGRCTIAGREGRLHALPSISAKENQSLWRKKENLARAAK